MKKLLDFRGFSGYIIYIMIVRYFVDGRWYARVSDAMEVARSLGLARITKRVSHKFPNSWYDDFSVEVS